LWKALVLYLRGQKNPQVETRRNTAKIIVGFIVVFLINYVPYNALKPTKFAPEKWKFIMQKLL